MEDQREGAAPSRRRADEMDLGTQDHVVELDHAERYRFTARFVTEEGELAMNEPAPLGPGGGPEGVTLLAAAAGYCLSASLVFAMRKVRIEPRGIRTTSRAHLVRTPERARRVSGLEIDIHVPVGDADRAAFERVLGRFADYCIVTESIRGGFPITMRVHHPWGVYSRELPARP